MRIAASSGVAVILLATSIFSGRLETAFHKLSGQSRSDPVATRTQPTPRDYESRLDATYMAIDSVLPVATPTAALPSRLTLAVTDGETLAGVLTSADVSTNDAQAAIDAARMVGVIDDQE